LRREQRCGLDEGGAGLGLAQQRQHAAALRQRPGQLVGPVERAKAGQRLLEQRQRFGQQAQLEVGVGELLLRHRQLLRHVELLVAPAGTFEAGQRFAELAARQAQKTHRLLDHGLQHGEGMRGGAHVGAREDA
jgi:hypothetical protein